MTRPKATWRSTDSTPQTVIRCRVKLYSIYSENVFSPPLSGLGEPYDKAGGLGVHEEATSEADDPASASGGSVRGASSRLLEPHGHASRCGPRSPDLSCRKPE